MVALDQEECGAKPSGRDRPGEELQPGHGGDLEGRE